MYNVDISISKRKTVMGLLYVGRGPPSSNGDHQDYHMFSIVDPYKPLYICHCYSDGATTNRNIHILFT